MNDSDAYHVSTKAMVFLPDGKMLALHRPNTAPARPLEWDLPGGELEIGEETEDGVRREIREEAGLEVTDLKISDVISRFNHLREYWVTIYCTCTAESEAVTLSFEHDQYEWMLPESFLEMKNSPRNIEAVRRFLDKRSSV